jgi:hypothetical protein
LASLGGEKPQRERLAEWWGWYGSGSSSKMEEDRFPQTAADIVAWRRQLRFDLLTERFPAFLYEEAQNDAEGGEGLILPR